MIFILSRSISISHQLADKSWEALVDDDMAFAMDCLCGDPDRAIASVDKPKVLEPKLENILKEIME